MSKNQKLDEQDEISTDKLNTPIQKTSGTKNIEGKVIHVNGRNTFMGKPTKLTPPEKIIDGKEKKFVLSTVEEFKLEYKDEGVQDISTFYVTEIIYDRLGKLADNIDDLFSQGKHTGSVVVHKMKKVSGGLPYWTLSSEQDYNESENAIKP